MFSSTKEQALALLNQVTLPPGAALPQGASPEQLGELEKSLGMTLPHELREWLETCNGPRIGQGGLYGMEPAPPNLTIKAHLQLHPTWNERGLLPVAGDGNGNSYVLDLKSAYDGKNPIYFVDHETDLDEPAHIVASDFWHFLFFLLQSDLEWKKEHRSLWPFNRAYVLANDPAIEQFSSEIALPWGAN